MRYMHLLVLILALSASGNASACLYLTFSDPNAQPDPEFYDFGPVNNEDSKPVDVTITNTCLETVTNLVVTISGNGGEFCLLGGASCDYMELGYSITSGSISAPITVSLAPTHAGNKKRKLSFDGITDPSLNDVSKTVTITGSTPPH